jgi:CubicO group peptidase (beta-lactamase class C family)
MPYYQSSSSLESLLSILKKAVSEKIIPGGVLLIGKPSSGEFRIISEGNLGRTRNIIPVTKSTIYDLASLTKLISTLHLFLILLSEKHSSLKLENTLGELFEEVPTDLSQVTIRELLSHQSGLPPWRPLYLNRGDISYEGRKALVIRAILNERPLFPKGNSTLYSDLGFILLGFILEDNQNKSLSHLFDELITLPLKLESTLFSPKLQKTPYPFHNIAPTEDGFRRGGPLD